MKENSNNKNKFKETEIGTIPESWEVVRLGEVAKLQGGYAFKSKEYKLTGVPIIRISNVKNGYIDLEKCVYWKHDYSGEIKKYELKENDILISMTGKVGEVAIVKRKNLPALLNQRVGRFCEINLQKLLPKFLYSYVQCNEFHTSISSNAFGAIQANISGRKIEIIPIPLPPLAEQKKIAYVLSAIQDAKEKTEQVIQAAKELKKSLMKKLFTEGAITGFMFDTNIFNAILDEQIPVENLPSNFSYFITDIQEDELKKTPDPERREQLIKVFENINQIKTSTPSGVWGISKWGGFNWSDGKLYKKILSDLDKIKKKNNNKQDALIGETAIKTGLILVTNDRALAEVVKKNGGEAITLDDFLAGQYRKLKETEIGTIPEHWKVVRLGDVAEVHDKKRIPLSSSERNKIHGNYPYCGANGIIDYINNYIFDGEYLLLAEDGGFWGKFQNTAYIMIGKFWVNNHAHILKAIKDKTTNKFLLYWFIYDNIEKYTSGTTRKKLNQSVMKSIRLPLPPLPEQRQIAYILSTIDEKIQAEENKKRALEELFKSMLDSLMSAKIRVNNLEV